MSGLRAGHYIIELLSKPFLPVPKSIAVVQGYITVKKNIPKTVFEPDPNPINSPLGPFKCQKDPKIKSKSNIRIDGNIQNESCSTT